MSYTRADERLREAFPNGVVSDYGRQPNGWLSLIRHARDGIVLSQVEYSYDFNGNRLSQVESNANGTSTTHYTYDAADRLQQVRYPDNQQVGYVYDAAGNRVAETQADAQGGVTKNLQLAYNARNQLQRITDALAGQNTDFVYDANGNLILQQSPTQAIEFRYNPRDQLIQVRHDQQLRGEYQYDLAGRRVWLRDAHNAVTQFVYDQSSVLLEANAAKYD